MKCASHGFGSFDHHIVASIVDELGHWHMVNFRAGVRRAKRR
jgi:hypothetical protein